MYISVPKEMWTERYGGPDMLVHKAERHWELMTYNQHPLQNDIYEMFNKFSHEHHAKKTEEEEAEAINFVEKINEVVKSKREELGLKDYQDLDLADLQDVFDEAMRELRGSPGSSSYVKT
mmetsp:Transcript_21722/g.3592  ORF Transcript_21722/g.3592 Transcript_21722/m.3592 type:complete len:120 (+) Transcript_21722:248-607(+)|eukprot:CAMPEP_0168314992 /NCGR_PEP_ID=MMETSP0210-20121227/9847_1 /TAXON_ID=40633 /ORGANISM="Condylostoma magnum, Strain COL2" /LENGTH=119 /DNA_ID=CAMNT_0008285807 /DNA_START=258 /DNA_END=617 /DNA_ORIENTATION=+